MKKFLNWFGKRTYPILNTMRSTGRILLVVESGSVEVTVVAKRKAGCARMWPSVSDFDHGINETIHRLKLLMKDRQLGG